MNVHAVPFMLQNTDEVNSFEFRRNGCLRDEMAAYGRMCASDCP